MTERRFELAKPHAGKRAVDLARTSPAKTTLMVVGTLAADAVVLGSARRGRRNGNF